MNTDTLLNMSIKLKAAISKLLACVIVAFLLARKTLNLTGWIDCYEKAQLAGSLFCGGVNAAGEISGSSNLQEAYELGLKA